MRRVSEAKNQHRALGERGGAAQEALSDSC